MNFQVQHMLANTWGRHVRSMVTLGRSLRNGSTAFQSHTPARTDEGPTAITSLPTPLGNFPVFIILVGREGHPCFFFSQETETSSIYHKIHALTFTNQFFSVFMRS